MQARRGLHSFSFLPGIQRASSLMQNEAECSRRIVLQETGVRAEHEPVLNVYRHARATAETDERTWRTHP